MPDLGRIPENEVATADEEEIEMQIEALAGEGLSEEEAEEWSAPWTVTLLGDDGAAMPEASGDGDMLDLALIQAEAESTDVGAIEVVDLSSRGLVGVDPHGLSAVSALSERRVTLFEGGCLVCRVEACVWSAVRTGCLSRAHL